MSGSFIDSNVLIYLAAADPVRADRAEALISTGGHISVQVLNEVAHVLRRKLTFSWADTAAFLAGLRHVLRVHPLTEMTHETGLALAERYRLSVYDGVIVAAALMADCVTLWSEDMQDGLVIDGRLTIKNPFSPSSLAD